MIEKSGRITDPRGCYLLIRKQMFNGKVDHTEVFVMKNLTQIGEFLKHHGDDWDDSVWEYVPVNLTDSASADWTKELKSVRYSRKGV